MVNEDLIFKIIKIFRIFFKDIVKDGSPRPNSGRPGIDFPIFHEIPETSFSCKEQRYKGFFGDPETGCQVFLFSKF
jgi:hypothetical protein